MRPLTFFTAFFVKCHAICIHSICGAYHHDKPIVYWKLYKSIDPSKSSAFPDFKAMNVLSGLPFCFDIGQTLMPLFLGFLPFHLRKFSHCSVDNGTYKNCHSIVAVRKTGIVITTAWVRNKPIPKMVIVRLPTRSQSRWTLSGAVLFCSTTMYELVTREPSLTTNETSQR
jgi:hypothetical protein